MTTFDHITIRATDHAASEAFYETVLATLGVAKRPGTESLAAWGNFMVVPSSEGHPVTHGMHIGFFAPTRELVHAFWDAGVQAGYQDDGAPGPRPQYSPTYYGGFLLDPDGNSVEAVFDEPLRTPGSVDHLWIRVADLAASKAFYERIPGFVVVDGTPDRVRFARDEASFSIVAGDPPTEFLHLAFTVTENATVDAFHSELTAAGYRDNGGPGERGYHRGYYAAFVFDPDGNNIELVNHNRHG